MLTGLLGLCRWYSGKESTCQCRRRKRLGFNPWVESQGPCGESQELMTPSDSNHVSMDLIWTLGVCGATAGLAWAFLVQQDVDITQWDGERRANGQLHAPVNTPCLVPAVSPIHVYLESPRLCRPISRGLQ